MNTQEIDYDEILSKAKELSKQEIINKTNKTPLEMAEMLRDKLGVGEVLGFCFFNEEDYLSAFSYADNMHLGVTPYDQYHNFLLIGNKIYAPYFSRMRMMSLEFLLSVLYIRDYGVMDLLIWNSDTFKPKTTFTDTKLLLNENNIPFSVYRVDSNSRYILSETKETSILQS